MRTRTPIVVAAVTAAMLAGGVSPAAAAGSERSAAARAVPDRMLVAPRAEAFLTRLPVRVVVRVPARIRGLRVRLGGRDVTARFRGARGSLRVARLTRRDRLRWGDNHLAVLARQRGRLSVVESRSFVLARRDADLVRLRIHPGAVTSLNLRVSAPELAPRDLGRSGEVERSLSAIRRERMVRVSLNGRRVTRAVDRSDPTDWTASLSAAHGLRYGVNRLRILVAEPDRGRYALLRRRFVVRRDRQLAAAGWDISTSVGGRVRLDGRRSRTARGGRPYYRWRIVAKPRGSHAELRHVGSARPMFRPDRPGDYLVAVTVTERTSRARAARATPSSADRVTVTVRASSLLVPFKGLTVKNGQHGIQVGDQFYANPSPNASSMQWLMLDRATLAPCDDPSQPCGPNITTGNSWLDGSWDGPNGLHTLADALCGADPAHRNCRAGLDQLVILSYPPGGPAPPVQLGPIEAFNNTLKAIGVGPIDSGVLQSRNKLAIVGVPTGGDGSGWYTHGGGPLDPLTGWLMPDTTVDTSGAAQFRFQPERPAFDTSSSKTQLTNTMTIRGQQVTASLPDGVTGGFQVVEIDPFDFTVVKSDAIGSNGSWDGLGDVMVPRLHEIRDHGTGFVAVQSIGHPTPSSSQWPQVASALAAFGANPHTFSTVDGSYAFIGGTKLARAEVADSSATVAIDSNKGKYESGTLQGRASIRADGYFKPVAADPSDSFDSRLYDIALSPATPWPYTEAAGHPEADAYARALADITAKLPRLKSWAPDLRRAYVGNENLTYTDSKVDLLRLRYPGDGHTCIQARGDPTSHPGYTREQFCNLSDELQDEFDYLDATKTLFDSYKQALNRSGSGQLVDLQKIGDDLKSGIAPDNSASIAWTVGAFVGDLISAGLQLAGPEAGAVRGAWQAFMAVYELVRELVGETHSKPVGDQITSKVEDLSFEVATRLSDTANGLDRLRDVIISDYGRLKALGKVADGLGWSVDVDAMTNSLSTAANAFFSSQLMPIPYGVYVLRPLNTRFRDPTTDNCNDTSYGHTWRGAPATAQLRWKADFVDGDGLHVPPDSLWVLGRHSLSISYYAYPPNELTDPMFGPPSRSYNGQHGYGMQLPRFAWEQYEKVPNAPPTDIGYCNDN
jgi:hypothetical protein